MHILLIEDNPDLVENLSDYLEQRDHNLDVAYNGLSGLGFAQKNRYDAFVLDLMLPGMDGLEVCSRLREAGNGLPVLMLTARDTLDNKLEGFDSGADDYLVKPFAMQELEVRLQALLRRSRGETGRRRWRVADLVYDAETRSVTRAGQRVELAPIPLKLLSVLVQRSPRVVTREELEREVWGDSPPDSDALRSHLHALRTAIDKDFSPPLLQTLRGIGYQLVDPGAG